LYNLLCVGTQTLSMRWARDRRVTLHQNGPRRTIEGRWVWSTNVTLEYCHGIANCMRAFGT